MGRLVKAFSLDRESSRLMQFNEDQFLREAGEIADRLRAEMASRGTSEAPRQREATKPPLRVVVHSESDTSALADAELALKAGDLEEVREALARLRNERDPAAIRQSTRQQSASSEQDQPHDSTDEQRRWTERHAEKSRQLEAREAELQKRESELQLQAKALEDRIREIAVEIQSDLRDQMQNELAQAQDRIQQLESDLASQNAEKQRSRDQVQNLEALVDELERAKQEAGREQSDRAKRMIEDCDRRITELAAEKTSALREIEEARTALEATRRDLAEEVTEQRSELRNLRETQMRDIEAARHEVELLRRNHEQAAADWSAQYQSETAQLKALRNTAQQELHELQDRIRNEQAAGEAKAAELRERLAKLEVAQQEALHKARTEVATLVERERQKLTSQRAELDQARHDEELLYAQRIAQADAEIARHRDTVEAELTAARQKLELEQAEFSAAHSQWQIERAHEAILLRDEKQRQESEHAKLTALSAQLSEERSRLQQEWNAKYREADEQFIQHRDQRLEELRRLELEYSNREQLLHTKLSQHELEWSTRRRQMEQDLRLQMDLAQKQLADERERFRQSIALRENEITAAYAELERQRQSLEAERASVRRGLQQMDSQLRWFASNLDVPAPSHSVPATSAMLHLSDDLLNGIARRVDQPVTPFAHPHVIATTAVEVAREPVAVGVVQQELQAEEPVQFPITTSSLSSDDEPTENQHTVAQTERRKSLEERRARLSELQAQLAELQTLGSST